MRLKHTACFCSGFICPVYGEKLGKWAQLNWVAWNAGPIPLFQYLGNRWEELQGTVYM